MMDKIGNIKIEDLRELSDRELNNLISAARAEKTRRSKNTMFEGANVWIVQKTKRTPGVVLKVNKTRCKVEMHGSIYNVPMSMLEMANRQDLSLSRRIMDRMV